MTQEHADRSVLVYLQDDGSFAVAQMADGEVVKSIAMTNAFSMGLEIEQFLTGENRSAAPGSMVPEEYP